VRDHNAANTALLFSVGR